MLIVDRIVEGFALCETLEREPQKISLSQLPPEIQPGDCLVDEGGTWRIDAVETARRRQAAWELFQRLKNPSPEEPPEA